MTYEELLGYCKRAVGVTEAPPDLTLLEVVGLLQLTAPGNRALNAEVIARFMAEYIEQDKRQVKARTH